MLEKGNTATNRPFKAIWVRVRESGCEQKIGRNLASGAHSEEVSDGNEDVWLETEWQRTWLDCVHLLEFCGR